MAYDDYTFRDYLAVNISLNASRVVQRFSALVLVDPDGYQWINHNGARLEDDGPILYSGGIHLEPLAIEEIRAAIARGDDQVVAGRLYDPFIDEPALYRLFARLEPTQDSVLKFASQYGDLTTVEENMAGNWYSLMDWKAHIQLMDEIIQEGDKLLNAQRIGKGSAAHRGRVLDFVEFVTGSVKAGFQAQEHEGVISFKTRVYTLMDAMKLQLAEAIVEQKTYRNCEYCDKPYEVTPQVNRADRVYCSDNCRVKAYQRRRKQAIKMREDGDTLREIAKALGSDMSTIKKWVGETNKEK